MKAFYPPPICKVEIAFLFVSNSKSQYVLWKLHQMNRHLKEPTLKHSYAHSLYMKDKDG